MVLVGQPVVDRDAGPFRQRLDVDLAEAAELDRVVDTAEHACGVLDRLLAADVAAAGAEIGDVRTLVVRGDLEPDPGAGRVLLEDERDRAAGEPPDLAVVALLLLEASGQLEQVLDLRGAEVTQREERATEEINAEIEGHRRTPRWRSNGYEPGRAVPASGSKCPEGAPGPGGLSWSGRPVAGRMVGPYADAAGARCIGRRASVGSAAWAWCCVAPRDGSSRHGRRSGFPGVAPRATNSPFLDLAGCASQVSLTDGPRNRRSRRDPPEIAAGSSISWTPTPRAVATGAARARSARRWPRARR